VKPIQEEYTGGEKERYQVLGSGVVISADGLVVTNNHVAEKAVQIRCVLFNKEQVPARVVGLDAETDLALLQLKLPPGHEPLPYAGFSNSEGVKAGEFVMALGSPFGFTRSISLGIVSNTKRYIGFETIYKYNTWIQTDAAINPGNSGGPLVNTQGEIIGINALDVFAADGLGFSIPSNVVQEVVKRLKKDGRVIRAWTGLKLQALKDFNSDTFVDSEFGVLIADVDESSPAEEAGVKSHDLLLEINGAKVNGTYVEDLPQIRWLLADLPLDTPSKFLLERRDGPGEKIEISFTPSEKGKFEGADFECKQWNMTVKEISKFRDPDLYFRRPKGIYIQGIRAPGNARDADLRRKDIILSIDGKKVESLEDVKEIYSEIMEDEKREKRVRVVVLRGGYQKWIILDYKTDYTKE